MINRASPVAPWRQLYALLRGQIESGKLAPGDRLPSLVALSQEYDVAHTTARKALVALQEEGLVVSSPMGTFVADSTAPRQP
ncbi:MAG TPA: GntR family transcriptional regulator [Streptosporangiaceae bacterium]|nr:GntR family transcriptional regulator [Streptosporangiaceae bacterium]